MSARVPPEVRLGNDVARNLGVSPQPDGSPGAAAAIAQHLARFWDPRMRRDLVARVDAGHPDLSEVLVEAVQTHRDLLVPDA